MRLASFNIENMFQRPRVLNTRDWEVGKPILEAYAALQQILEKESYSAADKTRIVDLLYKLGLASSDESAWVFLRRSRGQLVRRKQDGTLEVIAAGRGSWIGWLELKTEPVDEVATLNTARVIADIGADVLAVVEAEDRTALVRFNHEVLPRGFARRRSAWTYDHTMLIDGNDDRGIDVGLFTRSGHPIHSIRSHVDDSARGSRIFSRDCPEYEIEVPGGEPILVLVNHFKSKGFGTQQSSDAKRKAQATRVAAIYRDRRREGRTRIAVVGDLNDTPRSAPLKPLVAGTDLRDVSAHPTFQTEPRTGTFGTTNDKIDYILLAPDLFDAVAGAAVNRSGVWHGPRVHDPWTMLDTLTRPEEAASDHAAIWCDLNV